MRLEMRDVRKVYPGGRAALDGVTLAFDRGLFGLLGPNGAGKTTLMKIACTLLLPTSGGVTVDGRDLAEDRNQVRERLGYLGQEWGAPKSARCWEVVDVVLRVRRGLSAAERRTEVDRLLSLVGLLAVRDRKVKALSGGMLRRLGVAQALAGEPELLIMDEPTVGLDPTERVEFRRLLVELGRSRTIILSTHIVEDVGSTCDKLAVLDKGRLRFEGKPGDFAAKAAGQVFEVTAADPAREEALRGMHHVVATRPSPDGTVLRVIGPRPPGDGVREATPGLEDAYLLLVGEAGGES